MKLWLARHATPLVPAGTCYGRLNVAADAAATTAAAEALAAALPAGVRLRASPLQRCEQLAQALQGLRPDLACTTDARLAELDFGAWEGQRWDAIAPAAYDAWTADFAHYRPGGGESLAVLLQRVQGALAAARGNGGDEAWITHAGVARCVHWLLRAPAHTWPAASEWDMPAPSFGAWQAWEI